MGVDTYTKLFENCVIPVLHYGAGVWGLQAHKHLQNVQNRAMRFYLGTHKLAPTLGLSGDLGWYSLELFRIQDAVRLWNRILKMSNDRITKKIFMWDWNQRSRNWSSEIRTIFYNADMGEYFDEMHQCSIDDITEILKSDFEQQWSEKIKDKVKLRTYNDIKIKFGQEDYLKLNLERSERSFMAQLRLGILPLHIETGRYNRTLLENRTCKLCNTNVIEDEMHFLLQCKTYSEDRKKLFIRAKEEVINFEDLSDVEKMKCLFHSVGRQTAKFIKKAYNKRFLIVNRLQ